MAELREASTLELHNGQVSFTDEINFHARIWTSTSPKPSRFQLLPSPLGIDCLESSITSIVGLHISSSPFPEHPAQDLSRLLEQETSD